MGKFRFIETGFEGLYVIEPKVFGDERGFFMEFYNKREFQEAGIDVEFVQDNHSRSRKGVLRGMHFQKKHPQGKLVRVTRGAVFDAVIDIRKDSPTFGKWYGVELSEENKRMLYVPPGFAHGFLALTDVVDFMYKCTDFYYPDDEGGIIWNDPDVGVKWPGSKPTLSPKDQRWPTLKGLIEKEELF